MGDREASGVPCLEAIGMGMLQAGQPAVGHALPSVRVRICLSLACANVEVGTKN